MAKIILKIKSFLKKGPALVPPWRDRSGFVILFAVTLASILLAIALGVSNIALNEVNFSASVKDSDNAFYAADTGAECALYNDQTASNTFVQSGGGSTITCLNTPVNVTQTGSSPLLTWTFNIANMSSSGGSCAAVTLTRDFTNPSYPITVLDSKGYNVGDGSCNSSNPNRTEREVQLNYSVATIPFTNGACFATHYACSAGTSINNVDAGTSWTWSCSGYSGGSTASCSENKTTGFSQSGATETTSGGYTIDTFTSSGTFTVSGASGSVDYLVVGGGGSGGTANTGMGGAGGGGGGGVLSGSTTLPAGTYTITIGAGGSGVGGSMSQGNTGGISTFNGLTALGGGGGGASRPIGSSGSNGLSGGSGGGAGYNGNGPGNGNGVSAVAGSGTVGQGNNGGQNGFISAGGGGGGGAGSAGFAPTNSPLNNGGLGGTAAMSSITGSSVPYGAGGVGGDYTNQSLHTNGAANTGNGGGGTAGATLPSGAGGSGIVIIRHL